MCDPAVVHAVDQSSMHLRSKARQVESPHPLLVDDKFTCPNARGHFGIESWTVYEQLPAEHAHTVDSVNYFLSSAILDDDPRRIACEQSLQVTSVERSELFNYRICHGHDAWPVEPRASGSLIELQQVNLALIQIVNFPRPDFNRSRMKLSLTPFSGPANPDMFVYREPGSEPKPVSLVNQKGTIKWERR